MREEREHQVRQLRGKMEQNAQSLQHQYSIQEAKVHVFNIHSLRIVINLGISIFSSLLFVACSQALVTIILYIHCHACVLI